MQALLDGCLGYRNGSSQAHADDVLCHVSKQGVEKMTWVWLQVLQLVVILMLPIPVNIGVLAPPKV